MKPLLLLVTLIPSVLLAQPSSTWSRYVAQADGKARVTFVKILGGNPTRENIRLVAEAFTDPEPAVVRAAKGVLRNNKGLETFNAIAAAITGNQWEFGHFLAAEFREPQYVTRMIKLLRHERPEVRRPVAMALGMIGDDRSFLPLIQMGRDPHEHTRGEALKAVARFNQPRHKASLRKLLSHADPRIRRTAIEALAQQKDTSAFEAILKRLMDDSDADVRWVAHVSLGHLGSPENAAKVLPYLTSKQEQQRARGVVLLQHIKATNYAPHIVQRFLKDASPDVRARAWEAILAMRDPAVAALREAAAEDPRPEIRSAATKALAQIGS